LRAEISQTNTHPLQLESQNIVYIHNPKVLTKCRYTHEQKAIREDKALLQTKTKKEKNVQGNKRRKVKKQSNKGSKQKKMYREIAMEK
jgi:hypothetical protein